MKKRKFAPGGSVSDEIYNSAEYQADKTAGLKASEGDEKVGFWKRIMMGNIDDPTSEAYKKFGAGRGQTERQKAKDDADFAAEERRQATQRTVAGQEEPKMTGSPDIPSSPVATKAAPTKAAPVKTGSPVTKPVSSTSTTKASPVRTFKSADEARAYGVNRLASEAKAGTAKAQADKEQARTKSMEDAAALAKKLRATVKTAPESRPGSESPMAPTKKNAAAAGNKLMSDRYKGRREGFDSKMKKTTAGKTSNYSSGGMVKGQGIVSRTKKCKVV